MKKSNEVVVEDLRKYHKLGIKENTSKGIVFQFVCMAVLAAVAVGDDSEEEEEEGEPIK